MDDDLDTKPKRRHPRKVSTVTKQEFIDDGEEPEEKQDEAFSGLFDEGTLRSIARVRVIRKEPNEGTVGYLEDPSYGEAEIAERWGGSSYLVQGIDAKGAVRKASSIKIAGDPIFVSAIAEAQWRRSRGLPPAASSASLAVAATTEKGMSMQELMLFLQTQDQQRRSEEREHQQSLRKLEIEAVERTRKLELEAAERARKDDEERERRRVRDEEERETRRRREQQESEQRSQQFMQQTIQMLQASSSQALQFAKAEHGAGGGGAPIMEAVKMVVAIKEAFAGDNAGGEGDADPLSLVIKHGGEWLNGLGGAISGAIREVKGGGGAPGPAAAQPSALAMLPPGNPLLGKVEVLAAKLAAKGHNPEVALSAIVDSVIKDVDKMPATNGRAVAPAATGPIPFQQSAVGVGGGVPAEATPTTTTTPLVVPEVVKRNVVRMQFGKAN